MGVRGFAACFLWAFYWQLFGCEVEPPIQVQRVAQEGKQVSLIFDFGTRLHSLQEYTITLRRDSQLDYLLFIEHTDKQETDYFTVQKGYQSPGIEDGHRLTLTINSPTANDNGYYTLTLRGPPSKGHPSQETRVTFQFLIEKELEPPIQVQIREEEGRAASFMFDFGTRLQNVRQYIITLRKENQLNHLLYIWRADNINIEFFIQDGYQSPGIEADQRLTFTIISPSPKNNGNYTISVRIPSSDDRPSHETNVTFAFHVGKELEPPIHVQIMEEEGRPASFIFDFGTRLQNVRQYIINLRKENQLNHLLHIWRADNINIEFFTQDGYQSPGTEADQRLNFTIISPSPEDNGNYTISVRIPSSDDRPSHETIVTFAFHVGREAERSESGQGGMVAGIVTAIVTTTLASVICCFVCCRRRM